MQFVRAAVDCSERVGSEVFEVGFEGVMLGVFSILHKLGVYCDTFYTNSLNHNVLPYGVLNN